MQKDIWPNFFIVGAPRCGTTTLHEILSQHPDIFMSKVKEPHYFSSIQFPPLEKKILSVTNDKRKYLKLFKGSEHYNLRGESSTYYLSDIKSPAIIKQSIPNAKVIIVLRNPIERAFSHYLLYNRRGEQNRSFLQQIEYLVEEKKSINPVYDIVELGKYYSHIKNYLKHFDLSDIHILFLDNLKNNPESTLSDIYQFLEVNNKIKSQPLYKTIHSNAYKQPRFILFDKLLKQKYLSRIALNLLPRPMIRWVRNTVLLKETFKPIIDEKAKNKLLAIYEPEITQLEKLLNRDCTPLKRSWN